MGNKEERYKEIMRIFLIDDMLSELIVDIELVKIFNGDYLLV